MIIFRSLIIGFTTAAMAMPAVAQDKPVPEPDTPPARIQSASGDDMVILFDGKIIIGWAVAPDLVDKPEYSEFKVVSPGDTHELCLGFAESAAKACHTLNIGQVGNYVVEYKGKDYPAYIKLVRPS